MKMEQTEEMKQVKDLRVEIDRVTNQAKEFQVKVDRTAGGREVALVITKLQEAKMWAGKILEALGSELPAEYADKA